jgi:hypothetical protein
VTLINSTLGAFELLAVRVTEGVAVTPNATHISPSSSVALAFNSDHVSGGVGCSIDLQGVDNRSLRLKLAVENPLIGRSVVSALSSQGDGVEVAYTDSTHCVVTCQVHPPTTPLAPNVPAAAQTLSLPPLRISTFCCCSLLETTPPHATPSAFAAAVAACRPDILLLQGCTAETVHSVTASLNVSLSPCAPLLSPPPSSISSAGAAASVLASGGHVIASLADSAVLHIDTACSWEGAKQHASCSAFAVAHSNADSQNVWLVSVNLSTFDVDVDKHMDAAHEETLNSLCQWLHGLLAFRPLPVMMCGFFGIPGEEAASSSSSSLCQSKDFSLLKSLLAAIENVSEVVDVFRFCNEGGDAGLTWDYTQNSTIESFDRLFARDSFVFILNPGCSSSSSSSSSCVPVACFVKPLGSTPATRLSPHFGLSAVVKLQ